MPGLAVENDDKHCSSASPRGACASPTLAQLFHTDSGKEFSGDGEVQGGLVDDGEARPVPLVLAFNNLSYEITPRRKFHLRRSAPAKKTLIDEISGEVRGREILAVLGASGAGKSTLIDALAGLITEVSLRGTVTLNGEALESRMLKLISAYVMQDDLLFPMLTVEETLMFAAEFRLPRTWPMSRKRERVQAIMDRLGLGHVTQTIIGDEGHRGISGGERRRVSIGVDIIHDPIVLFLDEPTSGLDSTNALMVVRVLKRIAESGRIVIMSIHQPSSRILKLLDQLIILSNGQSVFSGSPASLPPFLSEFGRPVPEKENVMEFALDLIRELEGSSGGNRGLVEFNRKWQQEKLSLSQSSRATALTTLHQSLSLKESINASVSSYRNPLWLETIILAKRYIKNSRRMPELVGMRLATVMFTGFVLATLYWRLDDSPRGVLERFNFFSFATSTMFFVCGDLLPTSIQERYIFLRETRHNAYRKSSYVISHSLVHLPQLFALSLAFSTITFWSIGLSGGFSAFLYYLLLIYASFWCGSSFVTFVSGVAPNVIVSYVVFVTFLSYSFFFSGFFVNRDRIRPYYMWIHYISMLKYPYEAGLLNEFSDPSRCFVKGTQVFEYTLLAKLPEVTKTKLLEALSSSVGVNITETTCLRTGPDILKQQGITQLDKWGCLWVTLAWGFLFRILFYFSLVLGSNGKRR